MSKTMTVGPKGQVVIPADLRASLNIQPGDSVVISKDGNSVKITSRKALVESLKGKFADIPESLSKELLQERRKEAKKKSW